MPSKFQKITGLFKKTKDGKSSLSGNIRDELVLPAGARLYVFPNDYKQAGDNQPEYTLSWKEDERGGGGQRNSGPPDCGF